ncbi:MAG: hypothetical protein ACOY5R_06690 [Pseudomonadota bacterium]
MTHSRICPDCDGDVDRWPECPTCGGVGSVRAELPGTCFLLTLLIVAGAAIGGVWFWWRLAQLVFRL